VVVVGDMVFVRCTRVTGNQNHQPSHSARGAVSNSLFSNWTDDDTFMMPRQIIPSASHWDIGNVSNVTSLKSDTNPRVAVSRAVALKQLLQPDTDV
jgi:hypothetical protein